MKRLLQVMMIVGCMLMLSTSAWSAINTDHVSQAQNGKGDVLIFPLYMVLDGSFQSKIQVINTKADASAVAKVIVRSPVNSFEVRDFLIFLSPTDVWEGTLKMKDGKVVIYSEDDSTLISQSPVDFASPATDMEEAKPFEYELEDVGCDTNVYGYVEVFLGRVFTEDYTTDGENVNLTDPVVEKSDIYNAFVGSGSIDSPNPSTGYFPANVDSAYRNILAGNLQIETATAAWTSSLNAVALKDYRRNSELSPAFDTNFEQGALNSLAEVEAALSKNDIGMPYYNDDEEGQYTLHFFNFPTKLTEETDDKCNIDKIKGKYVGFPKVGVDYSGFDLSENTKETKKPIVSPYPDAETTTFNEELTLHVPSTYSQGWYRYIFNDGATTGLETINGDTLEYDGAPVIPVTLHFGQRGLSMQYGFWTNTDVKVNDEIVGGYQYTQGYVTTTEY